MVYFSFTNGIAYVLYTQWGHIGCLLVPKQPEREGKSIPIYANLYDVMSNMFHGNSMWNFLCKEIIGILKAITFYKKPNYRHSSFQHIKWVYGVSIQSSSILKSPKNLLYGKLEVSVQKHCLRAIPVS